MRTYGVRLQRSVPLRLRDHPDSPNVLTLRDWCAQQTASGRPLAIDLFAGAGGLSLGLHDAGWSVAAAVDHDPAATQTHRANIPGLALDLDLGEEDDRLRLTQLFDGIPIDLVAGGPPCQPFSRAGRSKIRSLVEAGQRDEVDSRKELWRAFIEVVLAIKPRAVLMENVPDMALGDDLLVVRKIVDLLESAGYATETRIVDAWKFGVPQHRKRLILLARNDGGPLAWPEPETELTTVRDSIADLPSLQGGTGSRELAYVPPGSTTDFQKRMRQGAEPNVIHDHMTRAVRVDDLEIFQLMDSRTLYSQIPERLRRYSAVTFDDKYKRLDWDDVSRTITAHIAKDGYWYIHPEEHRTLTVREAARLQTFPDSFRFSGTRSDAFRQIGNAVPPRLAAVAAGILSTPAEDSASVLPANHWLEARRALADWARQQSTGHHWHMVPGTQVTAPVALGAAVLSGHRMSESAVGEALRGMRGRAKLSSDDVRQAGLSLGGRARGSLERLIPLGRKQKAWLAPGSLPALVPLNVREQQLFRLLMGEDVMLRGQGPLRVAARISGTESAQQNRGTDGRVDLARLVGSGPEAPLRMAGIRLLAATACGTTKSDCLACPMRAWCQTAASSTGTTARSAP